MTQGNDRSRTHETLKTPATASAKQHQGSIPETNNHAQRPTVRIVCTRPRRVKGVPFDPRPLYGAFFSACVDLDTLADRIGCTADTLKNAVSGKSPNSPVAIRACQLLGVPLEALWPAPAEDVAALHAEEALP